MLEPLKQIGAEIIDRREESTEYRALIFFPGWDFARISPTGSVLQEARRSVPLAVLFKYLGVYYEEFGDTRPQIRAGKRVDLVFVPQRQGPHSKQEVSWVKKILKMLDFIDLI